VPEIKQYIRTIKEHPQSVINMLPFKGYLSQTVIEWINYSVFWLNSLLAIGGVSEVLSPRTIVGGITSIV
jgi:hypothetical protein